MKTDRNLIATTQVQILRTTEFAGFKAMGLAALVLALLTLVFVNNATAGLGYDIPEMIKISDSSSYVALTSYPAILNSTEKSSSRLSAFTKWSSMFERFSHQASTGQGTKDLLALKEALRPLKGQQISEMASQVNDIMNARPYITDNRNWGKSDYWATPVEFLARGGDCEDFAIAKYTALRMLGVPEQRLRLAIVQDTWKNIAHAILVVYTEKGPMILDNQTDDMISASDSGRYQPIFSINRQAWWLHKEKPMTRVASAY